MIPIHHAAEFLISRRQNFPPNVTIFAEKGVSERVSTEAYKSEASNFPLFV